MTINDITALDYKVSGDTLTMVLSDTTQDAILAMDTAAITVKTDVGDTVETLLGYAITTITYDIVSQAYTVTAARDCDAGMAAALQRVNARLDTLQADENTISDIMLALAELAEIVMQGMEV